MRQTRTDANRQRVTARAQARPVIGTNLRQLAGMHGLLQRELAAHLGLSEQGLWNILNGRSEPRTRTVQVCAHAFGISVDSLLGDTGSCLRAAAAAYERAPVREALARLLDDRPAALA
jgi:transcriptional regulator with XRE-family HTH domain